MNFYKEKLIGALIGIARATDGNEHLITDVSTALIRTCLAAPVSNEHDLQILMDRAEEIKRAMVPDCFTCASPCGRTAAFDFSELGKLDSRIRDLKLRLLDCLCELSETGRGEDKLLYQGLIVIAMEDYPERELRLLLHGAENW